MNVAISTDTRLFSDALKRVRGPWREDSLSDTGPVEMVSVLVWRFGQLLKLKVEQHRALWTQRDSEVHHPAQARLGATYLSPFSVVGSQRSWRWLLAPHSHPAISPGWASVMLVPAREGLWQACDRVGEFLGQVVLAMAHGTTHMGHRCTLGHFSTPWMLWLPPSHFALDQCWEYLKTS